MLLALSILLHWMPLLSVEPDSIRETSGLAFRLLWFETEDDSRDSAITRVVFPGGTDYPSQTIRSSDPILPGAEVLCDDQGNVSFVYEDDIPVESSHPLLMGFIGDVTFHGPSYREVNERDVSWRKRIPSAIKHDYLTDEPEYDLFDPDVQRVAIELQRDRPPPIHQLERIWEFVHDNVKADLPPRPNTGAEVLRLGKGLCGEFTRLTVTLSRACRLPARETHAFGMFINGPMSNDHAWADVFLPGSGWTPVQSQESLPKNHRYPLHYYRYLVVYRGISFVEKHRVIEHQNVLQNRSSGVGFFAEIPILSREKSDSIRLRKEIVRRLQSIACDDGTKAPTLFSEVERSYDSVKPILYWALAGSKDIETGCAAATKLVELCQRPGSELEISKFVDASPTLVRVRIDRALGEESVPEEGVQFEGRTYYVYDKKMPWYAAKKYCEMLGGHLVSITSLEEQRFVQTLPKRLGKGNRFWIGLSQHEAAGPWSWVTDEAFSYSNWAKGFPDPSKPLWSMRTRIEDRNASSDFAALAFSPNRWIDAEGTQLKGFVCEWEETPR